MLKRREWPSALLSVGGRFLRIWGVVLVAVVLPTALRSLGTSLPVPLKGEFF